MSVINLSVIFLYSMEYWFRCMDLDGDGVISMYEMEFFYEEQVEKMEMLGIETLPFQDCLCQVCSLVNPSFVFMRLILLYYV